MMYNYPFYFPKKNYYNYSSPPYQKKIVSNNLANENDFIGKTKKEEPSKKNISSPVFEVFGIILYSDDILLILLIFFLYNEGVKDDYLFIALILLLLS